MARAVLAFALLCATLAACGSDDEGAAGLAAAAPENAAIAAELPPQLAARGELKVATSADYAPVAYIDEDDEIVGLDPELGRAIGATLGLETEVVNTGFDGILAGLGAGKYDIVLSGINDTVEREKRFDFVTYFTAGTAFYANAGKATDVAGLEDLCGRRVGVGRGTIQQEYVTEQDADCKAAGEPGIGIEIFPDQNAVTLALASGRADVAMADSPVAAHIALQSQGKLEVVGKTFATASYGIAMPKGSGLAEPLRKAVDALIEDGTYGEILARRGLEDGALERAEINAAKH